MSGRKHNKIKIDSFEPILLFFLSADAAFRQAQYATFRQAQYATFRQAQSIAFRQAQSIAFRQARIGKLSASLCGTSPKERKAKYLSKFIQFVKTVCFRPDTI